MGLGFAERVGKEQERIHYGGGVGVGIAVVAGPERAEVEAGLEVGLETVLVADCSQETSRLA